MTDVYNPNIYEKVDNKQTNQKTIKPGISLTLTNCIEVDD